MNATPWVLTRDMFLSEQEVNQLLATLQSNVDSADGDASITAKTDQLIVTCLLFSGLRNSEFCKLELANTVIGTGQSTFVVAGTRKQDRTVYVPQFVSDLVASFVDETRPHQLPAKVKPKDKAQPLIFNERGRPYERTALYRRVVRILTNSGFGDRASVQLLRHTYGFLGYLRTGGNLLFLQQQMGHAHPMVTRVYADFIEEDYQQLANRVGGGMLNA